jgi:catechol 2,3-dioxygenase-like lactoylglutathione lyase family enzyme
MALRLVRVILNVRDMERELAFWRDVMGLEVKGDLSDPTVAELGAGEGSILLMKGGKLGDFEYGPRVVLFAEDVADRREELELLGIKVGKMKEFGGHMAFDGVDPEGNPFQVTNRG